MSLNGSGNAPKLTSLCCPDSLLWCSLPPISSSHPDEGSPHLLRHPVSPYIQRTARRTQLTCCRLFRTTPVSPSFTSFSLSSARTTTRRFSETLRLFVSTRARRRSYDINSSPFFLFRLSLSQSLITLRELKFYGGIAKLRLTRLYAL